MIRYKGKKLICMITVPIVVAGLTFSNPFASVALATGTDTAETSDESKDKEETKKKDMNALEQSIKEKESAIADAKNEKNALAKGKTDVEKVKKSLEQSKANLSQYVTELDAQVASIEEKIEQLNKDIDDKNAEIDRTREDLKEAIAIKDNQYECMKKRVQAVYEQGDNYYLELLLNAKGLGDFLNQMDYVDDLSKYDEKMFKEYAETVEYVKVCQAELEEEEALLQETKQAAEDEQKTCETHSLHTRQRR